MLGKAAQTLQKEDSHIQESRELLQLQGDQILNLKLLLKFLLIIKFSNENRNPSSIGFPAHYPRDLSTSIKATGSPP